MSSGNRPPADGLHQQLFDFLLQDFSWIDLGRLAGWGFYRSRGEPRRARTQKQAVLVSVRLARPGGLDTKAFWGVTLWHRVSLPEASMRQKDGWIGAHT